LSVATGPPNALGSVRPPPKPCGPHGRRVRTALRGRLRNRHTGAARHWWTHSAAATATRRAGGGHPSRRPGRGHAGACPSAMGDRDSATIGSMAGLARPWSPARAAARVEPGRAAAARVPVGRLPRLRPAALTAARRSATGRRSRAPAPAGGPPPPPAAPRAAPPAAATNGACVGASR